MLQTMRQKKPFLSILTAITLSLSLSFCTPQDQTLSNGSGSGTNWGDGLGHGYLGKSQKFDGPNNELQMLKPVDGDIVKLDADGNSPDVNVVLNCTPGSELQLFDAWKNGNIIKRSSDSYVCDSNGQLNVDIQLDDAQEGWQSLLVTQEFTNDQGLTETLQVWQTVLIKHTEDSGTATGGTDSTVLQDDSKLKFNTPLVGSNEIIENDLLMTIQIKCTYQNNANDTITLESSALDSSDSDNLIAQCESNNLANKDILLNQSSMNSSVALKALQNINNQTYKTETTVQLTQSTQNDGSGGGQNSVLAFITPSEDGLEVGRQFDVSISCEDGKWIQFFSNKIKNNGALHQCGQITTGLLNVQLEFETGVTGAQAFWLEAKQFEDNIKVNRFIIANLDTQDDGTSNAFSFEFTSPAAGETFTDSVDIEMNCIPGEVVEFFSARLLNNGQEQHDCPASGLLGASPDTLTLEFVQDNQMHSFFLEAQQSDGSIQTLLMHVDQQ